MKPADMRRQPVDATSAGIRQAPSKKPPTRRQKDRDSTPYIERGGASFVYEFLFLSLSNQPINYLVHRKPVGKRPTSFRKSTTGFSGSTVKQRL